MQKYGGGGGKADTLKRNYSHRRDEQRRLNDVASKFLIKYTMRGFDLFSKLGDSANIEREHAE